MVLEYELESRATISVKELEVMSGEVECRCKPTQAKPLTEGAWRSRSQE